MRATILTTSDASGAQKESALFIPDGYLNPFAIGIGVDVTGTVSYTVQHTFDNPFAVGFDPATAKWFDHATLAAQTTDKDGNYQFRVRAIRLIQATGSGSVAATFLQSG